MAIREESSQRTDRAIEAANLRCLQVAHMSIVCTFCGASDIDEALASRCVLRLRAEAACHARAGGIRLETQAARAPN